MVLVTFESVGKTFGATIQMKPVLSQRAFCFVAFYKMNLTVEEKIEYMEDCKVVCEQPVVSLGGEGG